MIVSNITRDIKNEYIKTIREVLVTPSTKKFTAKAKRFFAFLKSDLHLTRYSQMYNLLINDDIHSLIRVYGSIVTVDKNYDIYDDFRIEWAKKLVELTNTKVCPYCNRNFIVNFDTHNTTVELDHYFPKNKYPYLAISLYNLIPSCHTCNHKKRSEKLKIYPYRESFNDYVSFSLNPTALPFIESNIELVIKKKKNTRKVRKKINNYERVLNISTLYENHKDIVFEMIKNTELYPESRLKELQDLTGIPYQEIKKDIFKLIDDDADLSKEPFSKLRRDISQELNLI